MGAGCRSTWVCWAWTTIRFPMLLRAWPSAALNCPSEKWGGKRRGDPVRRLRLESGDVVVWGGPARFIYHGVAPLKDGQHALTGAARINLTFRKVF